MTSLEESTTDQIDRRIDVRREWDRRAVAVLVTAAAMAISFGVSWGTSTAALAQKVDKVEQLKVDAALEKRLDRQETRSDAVIEAVNRVQAGVDSANVRLRQLACDGQKPSCR